MKIKSYIPVLILSVFILGTTQSFAQTKEDKEASKVAKIAESCSTISGKISSRKAQLEKSISSINNSITKIEGIVNKRVASLNEKGVNTSEITTNLATFKSNAQGVISAKQNSVATLNALNTSTCQSDKKAFSENLKSFNASVKQQNSQQKTLKTYVRENIIAKIKALGKTNE